MSLTTVLLIMVFFFFFFQAEDGIRDGRVTGVQTCALPISETKIIDGRSVRVAHYRAKFVLKVPACTAVANDLGITITANISMCRFPPWQQIGRASCRERVEIAVVAGALKKKR